MAAPDILIGNVASTTNVTARDNCTNLALGCSVNLERVNRAGGARGRKA